MKTKYILLVLGIILVSTPNFYSQKKKKSKNAKAPTNQIDSVSYSIGISIAKSFQGEFPDINIEQFINGLNSKLSENSEPLFTDIEAQKNVEVYFKSKQQQALAKEKEKYNDVIKEGEDFLKNNAKKPGVTTLESGLQYEIISKGASIKTFNKKVNLTFNLIIQLK